MEKEHDIGDDEEGQGREIEGECPLEGIDAASVESAATTLTDRFLAAGQRPMPMELIAGFASNERFHERPDELNPASVKRLSSYPVSRAMARSIGAPIVVVCPWPNARFVRVSGRD